MHSESIRALIIEKHHNGVPYAEIGKQLNISRKTVWGICNTKVKKRVKKANPVGRPKSLSPEMIKKITYHAQSQQKLHRKVTSTTIKRKFNLNVGKKVIQRALRSKNFRFCKIK